jgi:hypothetical protein
MRRVPVWLQLQLRLLWLHCVLKQLRVSQVPVWLQLLWLQLVVKQLQVSHWAGRLLVWLLVWLQLQLL